MAKVTLRKTRETRVRGGHPWIYASEIEKVEGAFDNGDIVDVADFRGKFIGRGFYNPQSQISATTSPATGISSPAGYRRPGITEGCCATR